MPDGDCVLGNTNQTRIEELESDVADLTTTVRKMELIQTKIKAQLAIVAGISAAVGGAAVQLAFQYLG